MNQADRDRLKVLHEVEKGQLGQKEAGEQLKLSERWVRKLASGLRKEGDVGILHRLRGRASKRRITEAVREKAVKVVKREYGDFGPALAAEYLEEKHGVKMSKETLRKLLIEAGVWKRQRRRVEEVHMWRARRACRGELVQWDSSHHDWLEGRGPKLYLLAMVDDATSQAGAVFAEHDTTEENFLLLGNYLTQWGRPVGFYTDKHSLFTINRPARPAEDEAWPEAWTQIGRALRELGIGWIAAHSPQAKGRVERFFGTAQDRLVKGLRKARVGNLEEARQYLEQEYLPLWNRRFTVDATNPTDGHRRLERTHDLAAILSHVEERGVGHDYTLQYHKRRYQIARTDIRPGLRGATVRVEERGDETVWVRFRDHCLSVQVCDPQTRPNPLAARPRVKKISPAPTGSKPRNWMEGFQLRKSQPVWKVIKQETGGWAPDQGNGSVGGVGR